MTLKALILVSALAPSPDAAEPEPTSSPVVQSPEVLDSSGSEGGSGTDVTSEPETQPESGSESSPVDAALPIPDPIAENSAVRAAPPSDEYPAPDAFEPIPTANDESGGAKDQEPRADADADAEKARRKPRTVEFRVGARVMAGGRVRYRHGTSEQELRGYGNVDDLDPGFVLRQGRLAARLRTKKLRIKLSLDVADALNDPGQRFFIRDAWTNVKIADPFQIKVGRFKRPFSGSSLRGAGKLPILGRGLFNSHAIETLAWGDRGIGMMTWGRVRSERAGKLTWSLAGMNGYDVINGSAGSKAVDAVARLEYEPRKWVSVGANGVMKYVSRDGQEKSQSRYAAGGDLRFKHKGFYALLEFDAAQDWLNNAAPWTMGFAGYLAYTFDLPKEFALQPVVFGEYNDRNMQFAQSEGIRIMGGMNVLWTEHLRVMPLVEVVRPIIVGTGDYTNDIVKSETYFLLFSVEL